MANISIYDEGYEAGYKAGVEEGLKPWSGEAEEGYALAIADVLTVLEEDARRVAGEPGRRPSLDGSPSRNLKTIWRLYELIRELEKSP